jgi:hypothetical protein
MTHRLTAAELDRIEDARLRGRKLRSLSDPKSPEAAVTRAGLLAAVAEFGRILAAAAVGRPYDLSRVEGDGDYRPLGVFPSPEAAYVAARAAGVGAYAGTRDPEGSDYEETIEVTPDGRLRVEVAAWAVDDLAAAD